MNLTYMLPPGDFESLFECLFTAAAGGVLCVRLVDFSLRS